MTGAMGQLVAHRGPDMQGLWSDPANLCHLAHRRLSIIDLSEAGRQPMSDASGRYVVTFNGELYNYQDIRRELEQEGHRFFTKSDTEVLLLGYIAHGERIFEMADGMFAVAIYDRQQRSLLLARDRAGEKPLYYMQAGNVFAFASELQALTAVPGVDHRMSEGALAAYLLFRYVPAPATILAGISKLIPGHLLKVEADGSYVERRYFAFELQPNYNPSQAHFEKYASEVENALIASLKRRLVSDVPLGVFLSAGIDSSLACALITKRLGHSPRTFTIGFENDAESEHQVALRISQCLGTQHSQYVFSASDFDAIGSQIGKFMDEPNGDRSCVPTYLLSKFTRESVTVAISGDGGDELFCGYGRYRGVPQAMKEPCWENPRATIGAYFDRFLAVFGIAATSEILPNGWRSIASLLESFIPIFQHPGRDVVNGLRQLDFATYLPGAVLPKVDRMSMRWGLEVRTPFLEPQVMQLSSRLSGAYCHNDKFAKLTLRQILGKYLPSDIVSLPKRGFGMPASVFINNKEKTAAELDVTRERILGTRFFSERRELVESLMQKSGQNINSIWATIVLGQWMESFPVKL
ncbi:asparagine synthase (glutamine-hydrolyzing) [Dongia soli]|uniref:asparagine synthase (glutamine-hydrolyzing) n=1 Tax=Dongia soli TaxID=600628 RepID=A0ABU5EAT6_9PROT|nr:asparagine synthase (glutamine-hydrolyzing) [Dongia soli]MDY0882648.1 asparagine synthase (glutamine-hydrolyzing) [Dongia soli]